MTARGRNQQGNTDSGSEEDHRVFVLQPETDNRAEPQPKPGRAAIDDPDKQINSDHPEQRFKRVHGKEIAHGQKDERAKRSGAAEGNRPTPAAEFTRDQPGQSNTECTRNRWKETDCEERIPDQDTAQPNKERGKRREIDITKSEMLTAGDVIELVAKITVTAVGEKMDKQSHRPEEDDQFLFDCEPARCWRLSRADCERIHGSDYAQSAGAIQAASLNAARKKRRLDQLVVIFVAANPYPFNRIAERLANGAIMIADAD
jgi:hypothetical protein